MGRSAARNDRSTIIRVTLGRGRRVVRQRLDREKVGNRIEVIATVG